MIESFFEGVGSLKVNDDRFLEDLFIFDFIVDLFADVTLDMISGFFPRLLNIKFTL